MKSRKKKGKKKRMLVTAGPTRAMIDPVRFISNRSTGVMGYEIARLASRAGWETTLISGPTELTPPAGVQFVEIETVEELDRALRTQFKKADCLVMSAAVSDFVPARTLPKKLKRGGARTVRLVPTKDLLEGVGRKKGRRVVVGFCLETENLEKNAARKLKKKHLDLMVASLLSAGNRPFGGTRTTMLMLNEAGKRHWLRNKTKSEIARFLLSQIEKIR